MESKLLFAAISLHFDGGGVGYTLFPDLEADLEACHKGASTSLASILLSSSPKHWMRLST
jgi:hypothetical protein